MTQCHYLWVNSCLTLDAAQELCHSTQMKIDAVDVAKVRTLLSSLPDGEVPRKSNSSCRAMCPGLHFRLSDLPHLQLCTDIPVDHLSKARR